MFRLCRGGWTSGAGRQGFFRTDQTADPTATVRARRHGASFHEDQRTSPAGFGKSSACGGRADEPVDVVRTHVLRAAGRSFLGQLRPPAAGGRQRRPAKDMSRGKWGSTAEKNAIAGEFLWFSTTF